MRFTARRACALAAGAMLLVVLLSWGSSDHPEAPSRPRPLAAPSQPSRPAARPQVPAPSEPPPTGPLRVVIISEDGLRPDVISEELTPRHVQLTHEGTRAHVARTIRESDTLPSHAAMLSGFGAEAHGLHWNSYKPQRGFIHVPTVFSIAKANHLKTAMIVGKPKLRHIALPRTVDHFERPSYLCGGVARRAAAYFTAEKPDLMFVHFSDPDEYGHSHGWMSERYLEAVRHSDKCLATLLDAIDHSELAASTVVIVTADHGGHGKHHSGKAAEVDREIPWIIRGPGIARDAVIEAPIDTVDTAATALAALGLQKAPNMGGSARVKFRRKARATVH